MISHSYTAPNPPTGGGISLAVFPSLSIVNYPLSIIHCIFLIVNCALSIANCSLSAAQRAHPLTHARPQAIQQWAIKCSPQENGLVIGSLSGFVNGEYMDGDLPVGYDCYWLYGCANQYNALIPFINIPKVSASVNVNSTTFTTLQGFSGNGSSMYIDMKYNPAVNAMNFAVGNAIMGIYVISSTKENKCDIGCSQASGDYTYIYSNYSASGLLYGDIADNNGAGGAGSVGTGLGMISVSAISGTTKTYVNKTQLTSQAITQTAFASYDLYLLGSNSAGTLLNPCTKQIAAAYLASGNLNLTAMYNNFQQRVATLIGFNH